MSIPYFATFVLLGSGVYLVYRLRQVSARFAALQHAHQDLLESRNLLLTRAYYDHLTGLANRSLLDDRFLRAVTRAKRHQIPFALVMVDLNNFKHINDAYGHLAGDQVLIEVSNRLREAVRASDTVARFGGDEFVLIVESLETRQELSRIGCHLMDLLGDRVVLDNGVSLSVSASLGFAVYPDDGEQLSDLLAIADQAMYHCKSSGLMPLF